MAKKIKLDFSKVEDKPTWNTRRVPEGIYPGKVAACQQTEAQDGTPMLVYALTLSDPKYRSRRFPFYCKLQQNQLWKLRDLFVSCGISVPKKAQQIDPEAVVGKSLAISLEDDMYNGVERSNVESVYQMDVVEDFKSNTKEAIEKEMDEDDDEDFDLVEEEEYEDDSELEEDVPEEDEDFDDEEDWGDEDFEDEDFDDEEDEEEEPPAPKKAPRKKAKARR